MAVMHQPDKCPDCGRELGSVVPVCAWCGYDGRGL